MMKLTEFPVNSLSVVVLLGAFLIPLLYIAMLDRSYFTYWDNNENLKGPNTKLVIGILSARENFQERQSIRETWLHSFNKERAQETVIYRFIVGNESCDINPKNRKDVYSCEPLNFTYSSQLMQENHNFQFLSLHNMTEYHKELNTGTDIQHIVWNASVIIRYPVIVMRLGLLSAVELSKEPIIVQLYDEIREEVVLSARFSLLDQGVIDRGDSLTETFRFQPVSQVLFPTYYECSMRILFNGDLKIKHEYFSKLGSLYSDNNSGGTVDILPQDDKGFVVYGSKNKLFVGNLVLSVSDPEHLKMMQEKQAFFDKEYGTIQEKVHQKLKEEQSEYNDILLVDVIDVYRNLPLKLLQFHRWVSSELKTDFVMKTDDDCYVDVKRISSMLDSFSRAKTGKIWMGNFRENWFVEKVGKWAEKVFRSTEYPQFACGSGNIVTKDISDWLARNAGVLFPYQGEDTSMGIWLSAIGPKYMGSKKWLCDKECHEEAFVVPQLSVVEMRLYWENKQKCGNICGCE